MVFISRPDDQSGESDPAPGSTIEPTPAKTSDHFHAWLEAVNSANSGLLVRLLQEHALQLPNSSLLMSEMSFFRGGGFDLRRIDDNTETRFVGILQDRGRGLWSRVVGFAGPRNLEFRRERLVGRSSVELLAQRGQRLDDWVRVFAPMELEHEPGTKWEYSNYGYNLLGYLIGLISGQDYYHYVLEHVFGPADMTSSGFEPDEGGDRDSTGYQRNPQTGEWQVSMTAASQALPAGMSYSTVGDLKRFVDALCGHRILDERHTQLLLEPKVDARWGGRESYGCEAFDYYGPLWYR